jgi:hypothetical protein
MLFHIVAHGSCCGTLQELLEPIEKLRELDKKTMGTF